jgi:nucleotide sugar dehydrogenase
MTTGAVRVSVVGGGRMGLPLACAFAERGAHVTVCDVKPDLVEAVNAGRSPYEEPGLSDLLGGVHRAGRMQATLDTAGAVAASSVVVVIVPAHLTPDHDIDYSILLAASRDVGRGLAPGTLVSYETTVSVGGTRHELLPALEAASGRRAGTDFFVAMSPERVKANLVLSRLRDTVKVVGGLDAESRRRAVAFYGEYLGAPVQDVGSLEAAEFTKLAGMLYRDVNIALVNELAAFSEAAGIDFDVVREAANQDGEASLLVPGIGVGGHCTPVYPYFMTKDSRRRGVTQRLAEAAREINDQQPTRHVERLGRVLDGLSGKRVHILGLSFRPRVKVDTLSPAYDLRDVIARAGAQVTLEDPCYSPDEIRAAGFTPARAGRDPLDAVVLNTAHPEFADPDFRAWAASGVKAVVDGRNLWSPQAAGNAGLAYLGVGRATVR